MRDSEKENHCYHGGSIVMPHIQKLRPEEKVKIARRYLAGEVCISDINQ